MKISFLFFNEGLTVSRPPFGDSRWSEKRIEVIAPGIQNLVRDVQNHTKTFKWWCNSTKLFPDVQISYKSNQELTRVHSSRRQRVCKLALRRTEFCVRKHRGGGQEILQRRPCPAEICLFFLFRAFSLWRRQRRGRRQRRRSNSTSVMMNNDPHRRDDGEDPPVYDELNLSFSACLLIRLKRIYNF
jgi:hypothetical protein